MKFVDVSEKIQGWRSRVIISSEFLLKLSNVFYFKQVDDNLKDVSLEVHGGELAIILGLNGSGKNALLEVISQRTRGPTRGLVSLNGVAMSKRLFQESCGFVTRGFSLPVGLTVSQSLKYASDLAISSKVNQELKSDRLKQILNDLDLSTLAHRQVGQLTPCEHLRLLIAVQIVRDPIVLLLDDPTLDLDPLSTYQIANILSRHAKKYNRIVLMTMEKARSDIFPFLDRVTYLSLGKVIFTGATRMMMDYFRSIGFPCPELENPLMYFLFLSTVDKRSERGFIESSKQIAFLAEQFHLRGDVYRNYVGPAPDLENVKSHQKAPLCAFGRPGTLSVLTTLISRSLKRCTNPDSFYIFVIRILLLPAFFSLLWIFSSGTDFQSQSSYVTRNGLVLNSLAGVYFLAIVTTLSYFPVEHRQHQQEVRDGNYTGPVFIVANAILSSAFSSLTTLISSLIIFRGLKPEILCLKNSTSERFFCTTNPDLESQEDGVTFWREDSYYPHVLIFWLTFWAAYLFSEQQTITISIFFRSSYTTAIASIFITIICVVLGSATVRSYSNLLDPMHHLTSVTQPRYTGAILNHLEFFNKTSLKNLPWVNRTTRQRYTCPDSHFGVGCRYADGDHYLQEKYGFRKEDLDVYVNPWSNLAISIAFPVGMFCINVILYAISMPRIIKEATSHQKRSSQDSM